MASSARPYYCWRCALTVRLVTDSLLNCPICNHGFLEEVLTADLEPHQDLNHAAALNHRPNPSTHNPNNPRTVSDGFNIQEYVRNVRAQGPPRTSIQIVFGDQAEPSRSADPDLQQTIDDLAQNEEEEEEIAPTPASKFSIERLNDVTFDENPFRSEMTNCAICTDRFEKNMILKKMPCNHLFHSRCLLTWLEGRNTCPLCRYELEIEDQLVVNLATGGESGGVSNSSRAAVEESIADRVRMRRRPDI